jgi:hypothetical protein
MLLPFGSIIAGIPETGDPDVIIRQMLEEIRIIVQISASEIGNAEADLEKTSRELTTSTDSRRQLELLVEKDRLSEKLRALRIDTENEISKVRYLKGLQIIKILYEKVLSLDHHFASVRTLNEINKISNPTQYQEYNRLREIIAGKRDKKTGFDLTGILGTNTIVSLVQTFTNMLGSGMSREEKEKEITNVECILDFTLRMQNDLNTIYFETAFLQKSNDKVKQEIELLFKDYTKPIGYVATLESCRSNDDWETINQKMEEYLAKMKAATGTSQYKMQVNLEFPIDRLLQFITQYNNFIDQGGKFYEKFKIILNSYENEKQCETRLPAEYKKLKGDIDLAIEKFNVAYKPVEVNGSKMKEILYGLNEFD